MRAINEVSYDEIVCPNCYKVHNSESKVFIEFSDTEYAWPDNPDMILKCDNKECKTEFRLVAERVIKFTTSIVKE